MTTSKLSPTLFTAFKQYKKDTARLATWLGDTATSLGYDFGSTTPEKVASPPKPATRTPAKPAPRLKGHARKQQKQAASVAATASSASKTDQSAASPKPQVVGLDGDGVPTTIMTTTQFLGLARFIADASPPVTVPSRVIDWACRAVMARRECANWFRTPTTMDGAKPDCDWSEQSVEQSNRQHEHFIGILEQVVDILAARIGHPQGGGTQVKSQQQAPVLTGIELLESRYAALALEADHAAADDDDGAGDDGDDGDWDAVYAAVKETLASNNTPSSAKWSGRRRKFQVKCDEDIEQEFFDRYLGLIENFATTREVILETWSLYLAKVEDLETASMTTMIALDKMQAAYDSLVAVYPTLMANHVKYARIALREACVQNGWSEKLTKDGEYQDPRVWQHARSLLLPQLDMVEPLRQEMVAHKHLHPSPFVGPKSKWTQRDQFGYWRHSLTQFFQYYAHFVAVQPNVGFLPVPAYDALTSLQHLPPNTPIPLMTLFILDVHLSIVDELQSHQPNCYYDRVWADLHTANRFHMSSLAHFQANLPPKSSALWHDKLQRHLDSFVNKLCFWLTDTDNFNDCQSKHDRKLAFALFAHCPMFAGMVVMRMRIHVLSFTTAQADKWQSVMYGAYVHEALRVTSADNNKGKSQPGGDWHNDSWPLMRQFIDLYGAESIFFGREPDSMRSLWTSMNLAFGTLTLKDLQAWQDASYTTGRIPLMRYRGLSPTRYRLGRDLPKNKRNGGGGGVRGREAGADHGQHGSGCNEEMKRVVKVEKILGSHGSVGASGVAMRLLTRPLIVDRLSSDEEPPRTSQINMQNQLDLESAVINGMYKGTSAPKRSRRQLPVSVFLRELRFQLGRDFMPVFKHDLLRLHVQSVKVLLMLREEILEEGRVCLLLRRCENCRRRDDFLPAMVWNLIRALGADEGTGQPLGPALAASEMKEGLAILAEVKELVIGF